MIVNRVDDDALHVAGRELAHCAEYLRRGVRAVEVEGLVRDEELVEVGAPVQPRPRCDALPEAEVAFAAEVNDAALLCPPPVPVEPRCDAARHVERHERLPCARFAEDHRNARLGNPAFYQPSKRRRLGQERRCAGEEIRRLLLDEHVVGHRSVRRGVVLGLVTCDRLGNLPHLGGGKRHLATGLVRHDERS